MKIASLPLALNASVLILTAGFALADDPPSGQMQAAAATGTCTTGKVAATNPLLVHASTNARHANVSQVRYTAAHAMPPARKVNASGQLASCSKGAVNGSTSLD